MQPTTPVALLPPGAQHGTVQTYSPSHRGDQGRERIEGTEEVDEDKYCSLRTQENTQQSTPFVPQLLRVTAPGGGGRTGGVLGCAPTLRASESLTLSMG